MSTSDFLNNNCCQKPNNVNSCCNNNTWDKCIQCPSCFNGATGSTGPTGATGAQGESGGVLNFADFYALMPPNNAATVAVGTDVSFPQNGPNSGVDISRVTDSSFNL